MTDTRALDRRERAVSERYSEGARARQETLCCPVTFDPRYLEVLPDEILERDYGCGDPTPYVREGDVVLDLGSGGGKVCWIAAQIVGPRGRVIGIDLNEDMLALAERHHAAIAERIGYDNVEFRRAMIQDLALDLEQRPLIRDESVDVVLSNCVLNLVRPEDKEQLFTEIYRVVKPGGRVAISDIVADRDIPLELQEDPALWSGCISGAYREDRFLRAFERTGFHDIEIVKRDAEPWKTVRGIEFRSLTVRAFKGEQGSCC